MSPEEQIEFAANAIMNMPIGKVAVGLFVENGAQKFQLFQRTSEAELEALTMTREVAIELHASLGRMLQ